jgi:hypothetical protein
LSKVSITGNASGTGTFTLAAPNSNSDRTLTLPDNTGTILTNATAGTVLQVVSATTSTQVEVSTTAFTDTGLTATITPSSASSKILVFVSQQTHFFRTAVNARGAMKLVRSISGGSSTDINLYVGSGNRSAGGINAGAGNLGRNELTAIVSINYLDSPATTSAITYKTQGRPETTADDGIILFQYDASTSQIVLMEIAA